PERFQARRKDERGMGDDRSAGGAEGAGENAPCATIVPMHRSGPSGIGGMAGWGEDGGDGGRGGGGGELLRPRVSHPLHPLHPLRSIPQRHAMRAHQLAVERATSTSWRNSTRSPHGRSNASVVPQDSRTRLMKCRTATHDASHPRRTPKSTRPPRATHGEPPGQPSPPSPSTTRWSPA